MNSVFVTREILSSSIGRKTKVDVDEFFFGAIIAGGLDRGNCNSKGALIVNNGCNCTQPSWKVAVRNRVAEDERSCNRE